tara:strand:+ start:134 stop:307 length:174 start_codon:yes stop_codon:yes gene_type:complete
MLKKYLIEIIKEFPSIKSGRKNYIHFERRINKNIFLTKKAKEELNFNELNKKKSNKN